MDCMDCRSGGNETGEECGPVTITPEPPEGSRVDRTGGDCTHPVLMRAITVRPGKANSAQLEEVAEPPLSDGALLIRARALGVCGTDHEIVSGEYGWAPAGEERLVLGHESHGRAGAGGVRLCDRRSRGRHRAPAGSGSVPGLCGG